MIFILRRARRFIFSLLKSENDTHKLMPFLTPILQVTVKKKHLSFELLIKTSDNNTARFSVYSLEENQILSNYTNNQKVCEKQTWTQILLNTTGLNESLKFLLQLASCFPE